MRMRKYVELGQAPWNEKPTPVGDSEYRVCAIRECETFIQAIRNYLGHEPTGACLDRKSFQHDFGTEYQVVCYYDETVPEAVQYARRCERQVPATWEEGGVRPPPTTGQCVRQLWS
jgi:hypothetical protein